MALLFFEGCDHYDSSTSSGQLTKKWDNVITFANDIDHNPTAGRFGGGAIVIRNQYQTVAKHIPVSATVIAGGAFKPSLDCWDWPSHLIEFYNIGGGSIVGLMVTVTGVLQLVTGFLDGYTVLASSPVPVRNRCCR